MKFVSFTLLLLVACSSGSEEDSLVFDVPEKERFSDVNNQGKVYGPCENSKLRIIEPTECLSKLPKVTPERNFSLSLADSAGKLPVFEINSQSNSENRVSSSYDMVVVKYPSGTVGLQADLFASDSVSMLESKFHFDRSASTGMWIFKPLNYGSVKFKFETEGKTIIAPLFIQSPSGSEKTSEDLFCSKQPLGVAAVMDTKAPAVGNDIEVKMKVFSATGADLITPIVEVLDPNVASFLQGKIRLLKAGTTEVMLIGCGRSVSFPLKVVSSGDSSPLCQKKMESIKSYAQTNPSCMMRQNVRRQNCSQASQLLDDAASALLKCSGDCTTSESEFTARKNQYQQCQVSFYTDSGNCGSQWLDVKNLCDVVVDSGCAVGEGYALCQGLK